MKRNVFYRVLFVIAIALIFLNSFAIAQTPASSLTGNAETGKKLYVTYFCWSCHGSNGRAGGTGPAIAPSSRSGEDLIKYVRKPRGPMPPYISKSISDKDLADIAAFLRSVPKDPDLKTIPLLNQQ